MLAAFLILCGCALAAGPATIYRTGFETNEGYNANLDLEAQQGWVAEDYSTVGDSGLLNSYFPGFGQQAYIGFSPDVTDRDYHVVWKPINLAPVPKQFSRIEFSVLMLFVDSNNQRYDAFDWTVYNTNGNLLFSLEFNLFDLSINYVLENSTNYVRAGEFQPGVRYHLQIFMDFPRNRWSAAIDGTTLAAGLPITTTNSPLNLGDVDVVWIIRDLGFPGNNFMVFDNYQLIGLPPVTFTAFGQTQDGAFYARLLGTPARNYAVEATTNLTRWTAIVTNTTNPGGFFDFIDFSSRGLGRRFYRARPLP